MCQNSLSIVRATVLLISSLTFITNSQQADAFEIHNNFGAGVGVPFAIFGVSYELEMNIANSFSISPTVAVGMTILSGSASEIGLQLLFGGKNDFFRYGMSFWSGTNTSIETSPGEYESEKGKTAGVKMRFQFSSRRNHCADIHLLKVLDPENADNRERYGSRGGDNVVVGLGYVHRF